MLLSKRWTRILSFCMCLAGWLVGKGYVLCVSWTWSTGFVGGRSNAFGVLSQVVCSVSRQRVVKPWVTRLQQGLIHSFRV